MKEHESIDIHGVRNSMSHVRMSVKYFVLNLKNVYVVRFMKMTKTWCAFKNIKIEN
jgi:hypothetical protein